MGNGKSKNHANDDRIQPTNVKFNASGENVFRRPGSFHEALVRQRGAEKEFDEIYEVLHEIGQGGLCKIFKLRKNDDQIGGSSRPELVKKRKRKNLLKLGLFRKTLPSNGSKSNLIDVLQHPSAPHHASSESSELPSSGGGGDSSSEKSGEDGQQKPSIPKQAAMRESFSSGGPTMYFALKVINLAMVKEDQIDQLKNEVEILKTLDHKNIIKAYETFQMTQHKKLMIVMELCNGGDMYARMPYTERQVGSAMRQVLSAINYMHSKHIVHRDLKLENILWESEHPLAAVKVIDFGLSKQYSPANNILTERVGTLYSMSPETMKGDYTEQADLWSIGVITFIMLSMQKPFDGQTPKQMVAKVLKCDYSFNSSIGQDNGENIWDKISDHAKSFISQLLVVEPEKRLTSAQAKTHSWFDFCGLGKASGDHSSSHDSPNLFASESSLSGRLQRLTEVEDEDVEIVEESCLESHATEEFKNRVRHNLVKYADMGEFRRLALNVIAKKSTSTDIFELRKVFDEFDSLNTGTLTMEEFKTALAKFNYSEKDIKEVFRKIDVNKTDVINYTEFLAATLEAQGTIEEYRLAEAFDMLDDDDSGYISKENLKRLLGEKTDDVYIERLIAEADFKRDGRISYEEFLQVFSSEQQKQIQTLYDETNTDVDHEVDELLQKHGFLFRNSLRTGSPSTTPNTKRNIRSPGVKGRTVAQSSKSSTVGNSSSTSLAPPLSSDT